MPKQSSLKAVFALLSPTAKPPKSPDHFLFLLGTMSKFKKRPTVPEINYKRGETLSYTAQALVSLLGEEADSNLSPNDTHAYASPSVDVLNGPDLAGNLIGERIAEGLFLALGAVARGKQRLQIVGHSRGAAEAMIILHELERIKLALIKTPKKSLRDILLATPCNYTKNALLKLCPISVKEDCPINRALLCYNLNQLETNSFLIDPVPGDTLLGFPFIRWHDDRFYKETPCKHYELLLSRDERSACFYPIVPRGMKPTVIPGHHGTALGNAYTQQVGPLPEKFKDLDTTTVQDLVLLKLFHFIEQQTHLLKPTTPLNLEHPALDKQVNAYLSADEAEKQQQMLDKYNTINKNDAAYRHFTKTTYPLLPIREINGSRYVHYQNQNYIGMDSITPTMHGSIVNTEHAALALSPYFLFSSESEAYEQVKRITKTLLEIKEHQPEQSILSAIVTTEEGKELFKNSLSMLVESIGQKYLRNHLSDNEKLALLEVIRNLFKVLPEDVNPNADHWQLVKPQETFLLECKNHLKNGIKSTIEGYQSSIIERSKTTQLEVLSFLTKGNAIDDNKKVKDYLLALQEYYIQANSLISAYGPLNELSLPLTLIKPEELPLLNVTLINYAALMIKQKNFNLETRPEGINEEFFECVKSHAIHLSTHTPQKKERYNKTAPSNMSKLSQLTAYYRDALFSTIKQYYKHVESNHDSEGFAEKKKQVSLNT